jgi:hypothetical protein
VTILDAVRRGYQAGLQLLPVREDGTKAPDVGAWGAFKTMRASLDQMRAWDFAARAGFGVVGGAVSGSIDPWDFDCFATFELFVSAAEACGLGDLVRHIRTGYEVKTPSGGRRWLVRYPSDVVFKDVVLARRSGREGEPKVKTLIEITLFSVLAPSNGRTHPSGKPYVQMSGSFSTIARYTVEERDALFALARTFDQMPRRDAEPARSRRASDGNRPGDDYNRRATWPEILQDWTEVFTRGDVVYLRRPGKTHGVSATINFTGTDRLHVFSSSTPFDPDASYSKFGAYATLHHGGDFAKAALALSQHGYGAQDEPQPDPPPFAHAATTNGLGQCVLAPLVLRPYSGWFARGAVHLIAGSSGAGKTTLILDLLQQQARGALSLGHVGARLDFLVLFADRGRVSNRETLDRMRIDATTFPLDHLPPTTDSGKAITHIQAAIERCAERPAVVFVEGADLLVEDPCKPQIVMPFVAGLRHLAEHYSLALILSVGAPKSRPQEQYALKRDQVFGSQAWARMCDTVLVLTIVGDGTEATRDLVVLHRNAAAEKFHLAFVEGRLVETEAKDVTDSEMTTWFRDVEVFTKQRFRDAFNVSGARAAQLLDGYVAIGILREKVKGDRTCYVYRRPKLTQETDGQSGPATDTVREAKRTVESVPDNARTDTETEGVSLDSSKDSDDQGVDPLIPLKVCPFVRDGHSLEDVSDKRTHFPGYTRAREATDLPAWVTEPAESDCSDDPIGAREESEIGRRD